MPRARSPNRDQAFEIWKQSGCKIKLKEIANMLGVKDSQVRKWKSEDKWDEVLKGTLPNIKSNVPFNPNKKEHPKKARWRNKSAEGFGAPQGNLNAIKHGAYQKIYSDRLTGEEKELYDQIEADADLDIEIKLLRLKIARLLDRKETFFYDEFGNKHKKKVSEEDRENGILACMDQLRRLVETKAAISGDTEKLLLAKEKVEFSKYKAEVELKLKQDKFNLEKSKVDGDEIEVEDDGFIEALKGRATEVWKNE